MVIDLTHLNLDLVSSAHESISHLAEAHNSLTVMGANNKTTLLTAAQHQNTMNNHEAVLAAKNAKTKNPATAAGCFIGAGLAMTGALGVGFGQGYVGGKAALAVAKNPDEYSRIRAMMLIGAAIAESSAIYALIIAILLIFVAPSL